jgi:hypothetical protein
MLRRWDTAVSAETKDKLFDFFVGKTGIFSVITGQLAERGSWTSTLRDWRTEQARELAKRC